MIILKLKANHSINLYNELINNLDEIDKFINSFSNNTNNWFHSEFTKLYEEISNDSYNTNKNSKLTIYLWDNTTMIDYIQKTLEKSFSNKSLSEIMSTIKNHIVKFHHPTQSILKNINSFKMSSLADAQLRLSTLTLEHVCMKFL